MEGMSCVGWLWCGEVDRVLQCHLEVYCRENAPHSLGCSLLLLNSDSLPLLYWGYLQPTWSLCHIFHLYWAPPACDSRSIVSQVSYFLFISTWGRRYCRKSWSYPGLRRRKSGPRSSILRFTLYHPALGCFSTCGLKWKQRWGQKPAFSSTLPSLIYHNSNHPPLFLFFLFLTLNVSEP